MSALTPIQQLLLDCLHQDQTRLTADRLAALDDAGWRELFALARMQRVRPFVLDRLSRAGFKGLVPVAVWAELEQESRQIAVHALRQQAELQWIVSALSAVNIPVIVLKGAYLRQAVYGNPALREMGDIDLMVPREHLRQAHDIVAAYGYQSLKSGAIDVEVDSAVGHHLPRYVKSGVTAAELHWNLTTTREPYAIDPGDLWKRAVPFRVGDVTALALSPEDLLLHLCLHASYQHEFGFGVRWACDLGAVIRHHGARLDWETVNGRAVAWKWVPGVYAALRLAHDLVGAEVPSDVLGWLQPSDWHEDILETAREQVFTTPSDIAALSTEVARLDSSERVGARLGHLYRRINLSPLDLAALFSVPLDSPRWVFAWLRVRRLGNLLKRYGQTVGRLLIRRDPGITGVAERKNRIRSWLLGQ